MTDAIQQQLDALSPAAAERRALVRQAMLDRYALTFKGFDVPKALTGGAATHVVTVGQLALTLGPPTGHQRARLVSWLGRLHSQAAEARTAHDEAVKAAKDAKPPKADVPAFPEADIPSEAEQTLLLWVAGVGFADTRAQVAPWPPELEARLARLRTLPDVVLSKVSESARDLENYIALSLDVELKNS